MVFGSHFYMASTHQTRISSGNILIWFFFGFFIRELGYHSKVNRIEFNSFHKNSSDDDYNEVYSKMWQSMLCDIYNNNKYCEAKLINWFRHQLRQQSTDSRMRKRNKNKTKWQQTAKTKKIIKLNKVMEYANIGHWIRQKYTDYYEPFFL